MKISTLVAKTTVADQGLTAGKTYQVVRSTVYKVPCVVVINDRKNQITVYDIYRFFNRELSLLVSEQ